MTRFISLLVLLFVFAITCFGQTIKPLKQGTPAPLIAGKRLTGGAGSFALNKYKGQVVVLDFWATWCAPCIGQFPHVNELTERFKGKQVQFVAVSIDEGPDAVDKITRLLKQRPLKPMVVLSTPQVAATYGISSIPTSVLIDKSGKVDAIVHTSSVTPEAIERLLEGKPSGLTSQSERQVTVPAESEVPSAFSVSVRKSASEARGSSTRKGAKYFELEMTGYSLSELAASLHQMPSSRVILEGDLPKDSWDVSGKFQAPAAQVWPHISGLVSATLGVTFTKETREVEVYVAKCKAGPKVGSAGELSPTKNPGAFGINSSNGNIAGQAAEVSALLVLAEGLFSAPIINETGLEGAFDFRFQYTNGDPQSLIGALAQAGVELTKEKRSIEVLVVRKAM